MQRINVKGSSGAGKSTLGRELAQRLGLAYLELDAVHHGPDWTEARAEELQARVRTFMDSAPDGWVIDGNYERKLGRLVLDAADTIVWLDLPLPTLLRRLGRRTSWRIRNEVELWNGNREDWWNALVGAESLFAWTVRSFIRHRREWPRLFAHDPRFVRLRSEAESRAWLDAAGGVGSRCGDEDEGEA
jgi:adenylate kinase family enzyme